MLAASLFGETSNATPSSVTSLSHGFGKMSSLCFWSRDPNFAIFLGKCVSLLVSLLKDIEGFYFLIGMTGAKRMVTCVGPKTKKNQLRRLPTVLLPRASWHWYGA